MGDSGGIDPLRWTADDGAGLALPYGEWFRMLRTGGAEFEDLIELRAPAEATRDFSYVTAEWAKHWPSGHVFRAVRRG